MSRVRGVVSWKFYFASACAPEDRPYVVQKILPWLPAPGLSTVEPAALADAALSAQSSGMDSACLRALLSQQHGVVSRRQLLHAGLTDNDIARLLRRKELARVHSGVYVNHTGRLSWLQRAWAALLFYWPAALSDDSALVVSGVRGVDPAGPIHVAVDEERRVTRKEGVRVRRVTRLASLVQPNRTPPRMLLEHALLGSASRAMDDAHAIAVLADACQQRRTTPARLLHALGAHPNLPRRAFLREVLADVASGAYSLLEHRYLTRVERPHGLPTAKRQRRVRPGRASAYRDVEYLPLSAVVELDGRLGHEETLDRWDDLDRDIESVLEGDTTMRLGWRQVLDSCRAALVVARLLKALGWSEDPKPCGPGCLIESAPGSSSGGSSAPGAEDPPAPPADQLARQLDPYSA